MKNRFLILIAALVMVAAFAFGCKKTESTEYGATDTASTAATATDTSATTSTNGATSSTTGTATTSAGTAMDDEDHKFIEKAAFGGLAEVSLGQQMSSKAKNPDVKGFADRMVADHGKANDELKQFATTKGMTLPADTDPEHKQAADKVLTSKNPDKDYMQEMVKDHDKDVMEFEEASKKAKDPDLKSWIDKTLPVLKEHQKMAHDIEKKVK